MARQTIKFHLEELQGKYGYPLTSEEQEVIKKSVRENFDAHYGNSSTGRAYELNQFQGAYFEGAEVATVYADYQEYEWLGMERRKFTVTLRSTAGAMMTVYGHAAWTLDWRMAKLDRCSCHPEYKGTGEWLCEHCWKEQSMA